MVGSKEKNNFKKSGLGLFVRYVYLTASEGY